jgi:hypothetical protein
VKQRTPPATHPSKERCSHSEKVIGLQEPKVRAVLPEEHVSFVINLRRMHTLAAEINNQQAPLAKFGCESLT